MNHDDPDDELQDAPAQPGLLELVVLPLFRYKTTLIATTTLGLVAAAFWAALQPNYYVSSGKVIYTPSVSETSAPTSLDTEGPARITVEGLQNEIQVLDSAPLFQNVAEALGPDAVLRAYDPYASDGPDTNWVVRKLHDFQAWWFRPEQTSSAAEASGNGAKSAVAEELFQNAVALLQDSTNIAQVEFSWALRVSYQSHDRLLAQKVATQILIECEKRHRDVFYSNKPVEVLTKRLQQVIAERIEAESDLTVFQKECGFTNMTLQQDQLLTDSAAAEKEVNDLEANIGKEEAELAVLREQITHLPEKIQQISPSTSVVNPEYTKLVEKLETKRDERNAFVNNYGAQSDEVKSMDKDIADLEERVAATPSEKLQPSQMTEVVNPDWDGIADAIRTGQKTLAGLNQSLNSKRAYLAYKQDEINRSNDCEFQLAALEATVDRLQSLESKVQVDLQNQEQSHAIQQANISNLILLEPASYPTEKSGPKRGKMVMLGIVGGFALGAGLAMARRAFNPRLQEPEELERICPANVLVVLPTKRFLRN